MNDHELDAKRQRLASLVKGYVRAHSQFPMALGQQGVWYAYRRDPHATPYNIFLAVQFQSALDPECMHRAIRLLVERHPSLRTTFSDGDERLSQKVLPQLPPRFEVIDASRWSDLELRTRIEETVQIPFDLEAGPLLRLHLFRIHENSWVSVAVSHHIVMDFWSLVIMLEEVNTSYAAMVQGKVPLLPKIESEFREFVNWQANLDATPHGRECQQYWRKQLQDVPTLLELPSDWERPAYFDAQAGVVAIPFASSLSTDIQAFASRHQVTPFSILLAALQVLIHRYSRQDDFLVGCPFAGRSEERFSRTVGFFANVLPIRSRIPHAATFVELVQQTSESLLTAMEFQAYPLASIVRDLKPPRDPSRSPVLQYVCSFEKSHLRSESNYASFLFPESQIQSQAYGLQQTGYYIPNRTCRFDMEFIFEQTESSMHGMIVYAAKLFRRECMEHIARNLAELVKILLQQSDLPIPEVAWESNQEIVLQIPKRSLPQEGLVVDQVDPEKCRVPTRDAWKPVWLDHLESQAEDVNEPAHLAIRSPQAEISYQALLARTDPNRSQDAGQAKPKLAVVCQPRGAEAVVEMLGWIRRGVTVVPIEGKMADPALRPILNQLPTATTSLEGSTPDLSLQRESTLDRTYAPEEVAYIIFTSGTTGVPKGVMVEHAAIANTLAWRREATPLHASDRVAMLLSHQFDAGLLVALHTLSSGATLIWPSEAELRDHDLLVDFLEREAITVLPAPPGLLMGLAEHRRIACCTSLRAIWCGGAAMPSTLPGIWSDKLNVHVWNFYGPTEAAVEATGCDVTEHRDNARVPIGWPIQHTQVFPISPSGDPLPATVPGELVIVGRGLARGYYHLPEETTRRFRQLRCSDERAYHTGDIGRILPDGRIDFLGRLDQQVKIRGYRIELEEIEGTLQSHPLVKDAGVVVIEREGGESLVAFIVFATSEVQATATAELPHWLATRLPAYKIPNRFIGIEQLPRSNSGKVDRKQLHQALANLTLEAAVDHEPRTKLEIAIAKEWLRPLGIDDDQAIHVDVDRNFFELGGDSLQAALLATRLSEKWNVRIPTSLLFDLLSLRQFVQRVVELYASQLGQHFGMDWVHEYQQSAQALAGPSHTSVTSLIVPLGDSVIKDVPLFLVHPPGGIVLCYRELAQHLGEQQVVGIRSRGLFGDEAMPTTIEEMAAEYMLAIRSVQPQGPYRLGGWSLGGIIAYEVARQLTVQGESIEPLVLLDTSLPESASPWVGEANTLVGVEYGIDLSLEQLSQLQPEEQLPFLWNHAQQLGLIQEEAPQEVVEKTLQDLHALFHHHVRLVNDYAIQPLAVEVKLFRPNEVPFEAQGDFDRGWGRLVQGVQVIMVPGHHHSMVQMPHVLELAQQIEQAFKPQNTPQ